MNTPEKKDPDTLEKPLQDSEKPGLAPREYGDATEEHQNRSRMEVCRTIHLTSRTPGLTRI